MKFHLVTAGGVCETVVQVLIPKVKEQDPNPNVVINIMAAIGELAQVGVACLGVVVFGCVPVCTFLFSALIAIVFLHDLFLFVGLFVSCVYVHVY